MNAIPEFPGTPALTLRLAGEGLAIDPLAGRITPDPGGLVITGQGAGVGAGSFRLTIAGTPAEKAPLLLRAPALAAGGRIGEKITLDPGDWTVAAAALSVRWQRNGVDIPEATGLSYRPGAADDRTAIRAVVTAANAAGGLEAATEPLRVTYAAPIATGVLADLTLTLATAPATVAAAPAFSGEALSFAVSGAGAVIDPATGVTRLPTDAARTAETVTVTASNSGGAAAVGFRVTVKGIAPTLSGVALPDKLRLLRGGAAETQATAQAFAGAVMRYSVATTGPTMGSGAASGVSIDAATGALTFVKTATLAEQTVTVTAANEHGSVSTSFRLSVAMKGIDLADVTLSIRAGAVRPVGINPKGERR